MLAAAVHCPGHKSCPHHGPVFFPAMSAGTTEMLAEPERGHKLFAGVVLALLYPTWSLLVSRGEFWQSKDLLSNKCVGAHVTSPAETHEMCYRCVFSTVHPAFSVDKATVDRQCFCICALSFPREAVHSLTQQLTLSSCFLPSRHLDLHVDAFRSKCDHSHR